MSITKRKDYLTAYLMISPLVIGLSVFFLYPVFKVFFDSFHKVGTFNQRQWCGINNYITMFQDKVMWEALGNTFKYVVVIVPSTIAISLVLAVLLNSNIKGKGFFRVIYFIPAITMGAAVAMIWKWIFNSDYGIINFVLKSIGIAPIHFISNPKIAIYAICVVSVWVNVGYNTVILLAGIQGIAKSYYESAAIDGASSIRKFFNITLPLVTPTLFFVLITTLIGTFQTFDTIYMMVDKGDLAAEATQSMVVYFFRNAFEYSKKGYASALAVFLFFIIMMITLIQIKLQKKWVNYD